MPDPVDRARAAGNRVMDKTRQTLGTLAGAVDTARELPETLEDVRRAMNGQPFHAPQPINTNMSWDELGAWLKTQIDRGKAKLSDFLR